MNTTIPPPDDYQDTLKEINSLMAAEKGTPEGDRLSALANLVVAYEARIIPMSNIFTPLMTRDDLVASVPIHEHNGRPYFVRLVEIPEPWRGQFGEALTGSQTPSFEGEGKLAYAWDWTCWVDDKWHGRSGPTGLSTV